MDGLASIRWQLYYHKPGVAQDHTEKEAQEFYEALLSLLPQEQD